MATARMALMGTLKCGLMRERLGMEKKVLIMSVLGSTPVVWC
jgi:hypothetical protein